MTVPDEPSLKLLESQLISSYIPHKAILEEFGPYAGQLCTIGIVPVFDRSSCKKLVGKLPLLSERTYDLGGITPLNSLES